MYDGDPTSVSQTIPSTAPSTYQFQFTGDAREYFRIWIVNLCLSIITLGVYSAWAKVRNKRYLYGHTWVADSNFEYHGNPVAILKGRIIAVVALGIYLGAGYLFPKLAQVTLLVPALIAPWIIARSMAFNAVSSSYRQIRFQFKASYLEVLAAIWPSMIVALIVCCLPVIAAEPMWMPTSAKWVAIFALPIILLCGYPYVMGAIRRLTVNHSSYGTAPFASSVRIGQFYGLYLKGLVLMCVAGLALSPISLFVMMIPAVGVVAMPLINLCLAALWMGYIHSRTTNLILNSTVLAGRVQLKNSLSASRLAKLYLCNLLAIAFTFGLMIPWAAIRVARYRAEALSLESSDLESFVGNLTQDVGATGEAIGEFFALDLSL